MSAVSSPSGSGTERQWKSNFVHFSLKIWHLVASDFQIFLRINWPQCMQLFYMCFCSFHVHESWYNVNIKILFLSDYWSGSRRVCPRPSRVTMVVVCRTCSCASVFSGQWVEARYAGVVSGHRGTVVYLLSSVMPKHYRSFYFRERIYLFLCFYLHFSTHARSRCYKNCQTFTPSSSLVEVVGPPVYLTVVAVYRHKFDCPRMTSMNVDESWRLGSG